MPPAPKVCVVCGIDVANVKRVKDPHGNYYCQVCYDARLADRRARTSGNVEVDFECGTCRRFFTVEDVYDEGGVIICKSCFAQRTRPQKKSAPPPTMSAPATQPAPRSAPAAAAPVVEEPQVIDADVIPFAEADPPVTHRAPSSHGVSAAQPVDQLEIVSDEPTATATGTAWHVHDRGQSHGPMSEKELVIACNEGRYTTSASIWKEGMADWVPILRLETLLGRQV